MMSLFLEFWPLSGDGSHKTDCCRICGGVLIIMNAVKRAFILRQRMLPNCVDPEWNLECRQRMSCVAGGITHLGLNSPLSLLPDFDSVIQMLAVVKGKSSPLSIWMSYFTSGFISKGPVSPFQRQIDCFPIKTKTKNSCKIKSQ